MENIKQIEVYNENDPLTILWENHLFSDLDRETVEKIMASATALYYERGDVIVNENEMGDCLYLIIRGNVRVFHRENKQDLAIAVLGKGEAFGEIALIINQPRTASVMALEETELLQIKKQDLDELILRHPALMVRLNKLMSERINILDENAEHRYKFKTEYRLAFDPSHLEILLQLNSYAGGEKQAEHCKETAMLAREMCKLLCPMLAEQLFYMGYMHEIGKISLPRELIIKERTGQPLTEEERLQFSGVYDAVADILKNDKTLFASAKLVGFLTRGSYLETPIETQILMAADDYLMMSASDYRNISPPMAMEYLRRQSGKKYNPKIIMALEKVIENFLTLKAEKQLAFIKQMNIALDFKDHYTLSHSLHTRDMSEKIARKMGLAEHDIKLLRFSSELHDVGKIHIPMEILEAPRFLTEEERMIMRKHATYSAQFFRDIPGMVTLTSIVEHHHERFDGSGYPDGLKGEEIPLLARIMTIADVYSALTTRRPYRVDGEGVPVNFSSKKAMEIMDEMTGHFDPEIYKVFKEALAEEENTKKTFSIHTLGCKVNQYETVAVKKALAELDFREVPFGQPCDLTVINTCTVTSTADKKSRQKIRQALKTSPMGRVVALGCGVDNKSSTIEDPDKRILFLSNREKDRIKFRLAELLELEAEPQRDVIVDTETIDDDAKNRGLLKIGDGCENFCTYCIVPYVRGDIRNKKIKDILTEAAEMVKSGYREIVLTAIHLAAYRSEDGKGLAELLEILAGEYPRIRIRLSSIEPMDFKTDIVDVIGRYPNICRHIHLPLQHASDKILRLMNRKYTQNDYREMAGYIRENIPDVSLTTDIIVGFPGEENADFRELAAFVKEMNYLKCHIFKFSPRSGTLAAKLSGQLDNSLKQKRSNRLIQIAAEQSVAFCRRFAGREMTVLAESRSGGFWNGLTDNYIKVLFPTEENVRNKIVNIVIENCEEGFVTGKFLGTAE